MVHGLYQGPTAQTLGASGHGLKGFMDREDCRACKSLGRAALSSCKEPGVLLLSAPKRHNR